MVKAVVPGPVVLKTVVAGAVVLKTVVAGTVELPPVMALEVAARAPALPGVESVTSTAAAPPTSATGVGDGSFAKHEGQP